MMARQTGVIIMMKRGGCISCRRERGNKWLHREGIIHHDAQREGNKS